MKARPFVAVVLLAMSVACAARPKPVTTPAAVQADYVYPSVPADLSRAFGQAAGEHAAAWRLLVAGQDGEAARRLSALLRRAPEFYPSETALAYVALARKRNDSALDAFDRVLSRHGSYASALAGRGEALLGLGREAEALSALDAAVAADASLDSVRQRAELLRLRVVERAFGSARQFARDGQWTDAEAAYAHLLAISPDNAIALGEMAQVERRLGKDGAAKAHAARALASDPGSVGAALVLADVLEAEGRLDEALAAVEAVRRTTSSGALDDRIATLRARAAELALPEPYRSLPSSPQVTRAQLAALVGIRFERLLAATSSSRTALITDARGSWAQPWILRVAAAGVMDVYANHTFEPQRRIDRAELAQVATRLLAVGDGRSGRGAGAAAGPTFTDIGPGHLAYAAAAAAVASGVMDTLADGAFGPSRRPTGAEVVETMKRLEERLRP